MASERVRLAVEIAISAVRHLEPAELDEAITEIERQMIAIAEGRQLAGSPLLKIARSAAAVRALVDEDGRGSGVCPFCETVVEAGSADRPEEHTPDCGLMAAREINR